MGNLSDGVFCVQDLNQKRLFCATVTGAVVQVNYGKRQLERVFQLHDGKINDLRVAEGFAVTASDDKFLRVWPTDFSDFFLEAEHESAVSLFLFTHGQLDDVVFCVTGDVVLGQLRRSAGVRVHEHGQPRGSGHTEPRVPHAASLARGCGDIRGV